MENSQGVCSVQEFLKRVWVAPPQQDTEITIFRGQLHNHSLLPKLFRRMNALSLVQQAEGEMLEFLKRAAPHLAPSRPDNDWDWLSLGQHYGMSTRMSDWSANPLIALFFAVELDPSAGANPVVYQYPIKPEIVERDKADSPLTIPHTRVIRPSHSHRSEAQAAWHVVHAIHQMEDGSFRFIPLADMPPHGERIIQIGISQLHVATIRNELLQMGMTHSTIYGDFSSVCQSIAPSFGLS
jgi:hypothetical protein